MAFRAKNRRRVLVSVYLEVAFKAGENPINATKINRVECPLFLFLLWLSRKKDAKRAQHQKIDQPKERGKKERSFYLSWDWTQKSCDIHTQKGNWTIYDVGD